GEHQLGELVAGHSLSGLLDADQALVEELVRDTKGSGRGAFADPGLEHPQFAAFDGELDVTQVAVVVFQCLHDAQEFLVALGVELFHVGERHGVADARDHVLTLRVLEVVTVDALLAGGGVSGEGHTGTRVHAQVAEDHGTDVDGGTEFGGDTFLTTVELRSGCVPGVEDRLDRKGHLFAWVTGERFPGLFVDDRLEVFHEFLDVVDVQVEVVDHTPGGLDLVDGVLEQLTVDALDRLAEHLDQASVGVPGEAGVPALFGEADDGSVVEPDVEDGLHHAGHGELGARTYAHQEGIVGLSESASHLPLEVFEARLDLGVHAGGHVAVLQIVAARLGGDGEAGGYGQAEVGHLGEVGALAAEEVLQILVALGELVDVLGHGSAPSSCSTTLR